jgi:PAS domain S-box-containing protein
VSSSPEDGHIEGESLLQPALASETPPEEQSWDIPLEEGLFTASRIPRPDPRNNPQIEMYTRISASLGAILVAAAFLAWIFLADTETLSFLFFKGDATITNEGLLTIAAIPALGTILLVLGLHPMVRVFVRSKVAPRTLDAPQRAILETIPSPLFFLNTEARLEEVNSAFTKAVGRSANNVIGRSLYDFVPDGDQEAVYKSLVKVTAREEEGFRCRVLTKRGTRTFQIRAEPYEGHNVDSNYIICTGQDITEDIAACEALESKNQSMQAATVQTLEVVAHTVEIRDPYLLGHHERVSKLCAALSEHLKLPADQSTGIELAARAHDIGTIRIPFEIQVKPEALSEAESSIIEQHAQAGAEMLSRIDLPWPVAEIVHQHHEFFDGSGYPDGLKGADISIGARILAVADAFDALTSQRPYRAAISRIEALQRLMTLSGRHYDPKVVIALSKILQNTAELK